MNLMGADFDTPHEFKAGDTISAEMMNELFDYIRNSQKLINSNELIGTWSCTVSANFITNQTTGNSMMCAEFQNVSGTNYYYYDNGTITFSKNDNGTFSYTTAPINIMRCDGGNKYWLAGDGMVATGSANEGAGSWYLKNNVLFATISRGHDNPSSNGGIYGIKLGDSEDPIVGGIIELKRISPTKILMVNSFEENTSGRGKLFYECDKQNLAPTTPATFTASASGKTVSLAWSDNSTDETGFKVLRKDSLTGSYSTVTTTSADATSYSDTVTTAGSYWYRVAATSSNGDSTGSKVVKVDVE